MRNCEFLFLENGSLALATDDISQVFGGPKNCQMWLKDDTPDGKPSFEFTHDDAAIVWEYLRAHSVNGVPGDLERVPQGATLEVGDEVYVRCLIGEVHSPEDPLRYQVEIVHPFGTDYACPAPIDIYQKKVAP